MDSFVEFFGKNDASSSRDFNMTKEIDDKHYAYFRGKRFLIIVGTLHHIGGAEKQTVRLARFLKEELAVEVSVLTWTGGDKIEYLLNHADIPFFIFPLKEKTTKKRKALDLIKLIRFIRNEIQPNYIIPFGGSFQSKIIGNIWTYTGANYACWNQEDEGRALCRTRFEKRALMNVCNIVSNSYEGQRVLAKAHDIPVERIRVFNNGTLFPDVETLKPVWRKKLGIEKDTYVVSMLANLTRYKDHKTLFYAWQKVQEHFKKNNKRPRLLLAGHLNDKMTVQDLKILGFDLNLSDSITFLDSIYTTNELIKESDLLVHSSTTEGCPQAVCEAMALGKPVIGTNISGIRQALGTEYNHYCLSEPSNPEDLASKIIFLLENPELSEEIGKFNLSRIKNDFSMEGMVSFFLNLIYDHVSTRV